MANYIDKYLPIAPTTPVQKTPAQVSNVSPVQTRQVEALGSNVLERFLQYQGVSAAAKVTPVNNSQTQGVYKNNLRRKNIRIIFGANRIKRIIFIII